LPSVWKTNFAISIIQIDLSQVTEIIPVLSIGCIEEQREPAFAPAVADGGDDRPK